MTEVMKKKAGLLRTVSALLAAGLLSATLFAQTADATRNDNQIQTKLTQKLAAKNQLRNVQSSVQDGVVTPRARSISTSANLTQPSSLEKPRACATCIT